MRWSSAVTSRLSHRPPTCCRHRRLRAGRRASLLRGAHCVALLRRKMEVVGRRKHRRCAIIAATMFQGRLCTVASFLAARGSSTTGASPGLRLTRRTGDTVAQSTAASDVACARGGLRLRLFWLCRHTCAAHCPCMLFARVSATTAWRCVPRLSRVYVSADLRDACVRACPSRAHLPCAPRPADRAEESTAGMSTQNSTRDVSATTGCCGLASLRCRAATRALSTHAQAQTRALFVSLTRLC